MKAKAAIISLKVDWEKDECVDVMVTVVGGDNPIDSAHDTIKDFISGDFPDYEHHVIANDAAREARIAAMRVQVGIVEPA